MLGPRLKGEDDKGMTCRAAGPEDASSGQRLSLELLRDRRCQPAGERCGDHGVSGRLPVNRLVDLQDGVSDQDLIYCSWIKLVKMTE